MYKLRIFTPLFDLFPFSLCKKVSTITSCKICRLRFGFDLGIGLLLKPCLCKGEEYLWIYPRVTINNDCIQHPNTEYFAVFEKCSPPPLPKLAFFIKGWNCTGDELCRSHLFMRKKMWCTVRTHAHWFNRKYAVSDFQFSRI